MVLMPRIGASEITFGDRVQIRSTPETEALGVSGLIGHVYGETTPSVTSVAVIGTATGDYAINVHFESRPDTLWFAPELVILVDHGTGTELRIGNTSFVRSPDGAWSRSRKRPWWKFWT